jgi:hypothetical protein
MGHPNNGVYWFKDGRIRNVPNLDREGSTIKGCLH